MVVNLIKSRQMFCLTLPQKVKGQYYLTDLDEQGQPRRLISIEAVQGRWTLKSNKHVQVLAPEGGTLNSIALAPQDLYYLNLSDDDEKAVLFVEDIDATRQTLRKVVVTRPDSFTIGRTGDNNFYYENSYVSSQHAQLAYDGENWSIADLGSRNGTYVNGYRAKVTKLDAGDYVYIMGLKIVIGSNYIAVNNPDGKLKIRSESLAVYRPQAVAPVQEDAELPPKDYFVRSPRFHREIEHSQIKIDPPPAPEKLETVPLALMLGPSVTMAMTSVSTALLTVNNVLTSGGSMSQALPTMIMSVSTLMGALLWPVLTKRYEKKQKIKNEARRQEKYLAYLTEIGDRVRRIGQEQKDILYENLVSPAECADRITQRRASLWERVTGQKDFLTLRLGLGEVPLDADVAYQEKKFTMDDDTLQNAMLAVAEAPKQLPNVPISLPMTENVAVGLYGQSADTANMLRSMILQLSALHSYDELKLILIVDENDAKNWNFVKVMPHFWNNDKTVRFFATTDDEAKELSAYLEKEVLSRLDQDHQEYSKFSPYYVAISLSGKLSKKCETLQQMLHYKHNAGFTVLCCEERLNDLPKETRTVVFANGENSKLFDKDDTTGTHILFAADEVPQQMMEDISFCLANIEMDLSSQSYALPNMLTFLEMFNVSKVEHLNSLTRWKENNPTKTLQTPVGVDSYGEIFNLDLHEKFHGPHGLVAGMTGSGKSEFIITYILSLAVNYHPDEVSFILIDYKGGGLTGAFEDPDRGVKLPHLAGTITNLDGAAVKRSLISIQSELRRRQAIFNEARKIANEGTMDIYKYQQLYRDKVVTEPVPHLLIISDEFAELKTQQPEFMEQLISAARIGRSLGVHLILATQKPSGVVDDQIWSNSKFRVCLKVQDKSDSQDMIKRPDAAELSQTGRFYLQVGFNELFALGQSAWCGAEYIPTETVEKTVDSSIQVIDNLGRVVMNAKPGSKKQAGGSNVKQVVSIVKYLSDLADEEKVEVRPLWLPPIPASIFVDDIQQKYSVPQGGTWLNPVVGEIDDPFNQRQDVLTIPFSKEGNCLIYGATGNGKTTMLTTLAYSLLKNHTAQELNLYIMDYGSETLKAFEKAPQVGGVIVGSDEEKTVNFFKMLLREMDHRRSLFSEYGGDYASYCRSGQEPVPNIVVLLNNYSGFAEQFEDLQEVFTLLSRDGVKYGIYFAVTAGSTNAVRYKVQQNFKLMMTMQLNDPTDYPVVVGKTDGLIPSKFKGRGLVALDRVYEFQTAYCVDAPDVQEYLRALCQDMAAASKHFARLIPVLPETVDCEYVRSEIRGLDHVPVGVGKKELSIASVNLANKVVYPVIMQDLSEAVPFARELAALLKKVGDTVIVDAQQNLGEAEGIYTGSYEELVVDMFSQMVQRNNTYKDAQLDPASLDAFGERTYMIVGLKRFYEQLSADGKEKFSILLEKGEAIYKLHFVFVESLTQFNSFAYDGWFKRHITGTEGLWIGDGVADQYVLKISKVTSELYDEIGPAYGYVLNRSRPTLVKLLAAGTEEE